MKKKPKKGKSDKKSSLSEQMKAALAQYDALSYKLAQEEVEKLLNNQFLKSLFEQASEIKEFHFQQGEVYSLKDAPLVPPDLGHFNCAGKYKMPTPSLNFCIDIIRERVLSLADNETRVDDIDLHEVGQLLQAGRTINIQKVLLGVPIDGHDYCLAITLMDPK